MESAAFTQPSAIGASTRLRQLKPACSPPKSCVKMTKSISPPKTAQLHVNTPLIHSTVLSTPTTNVFLKLENTQPSGSFKIRGHGYLCSTAAQEGVTHFVSSSGGNAGAAVAYAGKQLGIRVTIVVPESTPEFMKERLRGEGAEVVVHGSVWDIADQYAQKLAEEERSLHISPFDHPRLWTGHATLVEELAHQLDEKPAAVIVSVGGGGLFLGVAEGMRKQGWEDVPIVTAETEGAESFAKTAEAGHVVSLGEISSIAKSLGALAVSEKCAEWIRGGRNVIPRVVSDRQAVEACSLLAVKHRILVEPACGAAVAALQGLPVKGNVVVVVCGGNMTCPSLLRQWIQQTGASETQL
ncbi:serine dehydratase [Gracilaria domingensis]|nr:serine dehydratase [Gracilaria domingensis]